MLRTYLKESTEFFKKEDNPLFYLFIIPKLVKDEAEKVKQDQELMNLINFIEENYCYENHDYMFYNMIFSVLAGIAFIITAAGINKLIIVMRNRYSHALRGKKEFNTDIITEDDED